MAYLIWVDVGNLRKKAWVRLHKLALYAMMNSRIIVLHGMNIIYSYNLIFSSCENVDTGILLLCIYSIIIWKRGWLYHIIGYVGVCVCVSKSWTYFVLGMYVCLNVPCHAMPCHWWFVSLILEVCSVANQQYYINL